MVILLIFLFALEIFSPLKTLPSNSLDVSQVTRANDVASKARVYTSSEPSSNAEAQELLLESLTLLRDVMVDIKSGREKLPL